MKRVIVGVLSLCIIGATSAAIYVVSSKAHRKVSDEVNLKVAYNKINKSFTGFIFSSEGKLRKKHLKGSKKKSL